MIKIHPVLHCLSVCAHLAERILPQVYSVPLVAGTSFSNCGMVWGDLLSSVNKCLHNIMLT